MIKLTEIAKTYGANEVLKGIDLSIPKGHIYGLVGKNGAGKTTLLNIISGISAPSSGKCVIDSMTVKKGVTISGVSYLPDLPTFYDYLTIEEYVCFCLSIKKSELVRYDAHIERLSLNKKARIKTLSRGNRQKVGLLIATITEPKVLLLDEPTSALDPVGRKEVFSIVKELKDNGTTIVFSSHILSDMETICDRIGFLNNGIIQHEIDMSNLPPGNAYEICFDRVPSECRSLSEKYHIEVFADRIIVRDISQDELFSFLSSLSSEECTVISVQKTSDIDLEKTMMEVLSQ